jgi:hypothetical protein
LPSVARRWSAKEVLRPGEGHTSDFVIESRLPGGRPQQSIACRDARSAPRLGVVFKPRHGRTESRRLPREAASPTIGDVRRGGTCTRPTFSQAHRGSQLCLLPDQPRQTLKGHVSLALKPGTRHRRQQPYGVTGLDVRRSPIASTPCTEWVRLCCSTSFRRASRRMADRRRHAVVEKKPRSFRTSPGRSPDGAPGRARSRDVAFSAARSAHLRCRRGEIFRNRHWRFDDWTDRCEPETCPHRSSPDASSRQEIPIKTPDS